MSGIVLTAYNGAILGPIARLLGWIMNGIYVGMYKLFGIENIGLSIILLTILIYLCLLPLTIKQQKFSKLSQKMQPELQAVQARYKNKKDQASMQAMQMETQLIYEKYGVSPTGSCVQLLIQMPILFALYRVFYNVPAYVTAVKSNFLDLSVKGDGLGLVNGILSTDGYADKLTTLVTDYKVTTANSMITASNVGDKLAGATDTTLSNYIIDILYKLPTAAWNKLYEVFPDLTSQIDSTLSHVDKFNKFIGLNISETPWYIIKTNAASHSFGYVVLALLIPVCSYLTQVINLKMMPQNNNGNDQMAQQMKTMNTMMPLVSLFMCFTVPVGLGIYWIFSAVSRGVQQFFINKHIENLDLDDIIEKNQEKAKKKREKMGITENQIREAAALRTKTIESKANVKVSSEDKEEALAKANEKKANAKQGSMAARANMVRDYNERNSRK
jgi:YidC/Oxa1 family membrane protein insertase